MTQYQVVIAQDLTDSVVQPRQPLWRGIVLTVVIAAFTGLFAWWVSSYLRADDQFHQDTVEMTAAQQTSHLVRFLRISAASDITLSDIDSIPATAHNMEPLACSSHFTRGLNDAVVQLHAIDFVSVLGGARQADGQLWRTQQEQAQASVTEVMKLFPTDCAPVLPVTLDIDDSWRSAQALEVHQMARFSDDVVSKWTDLFLLAESPAERELALAGLWQVITWETMWHPGGSPLSF